MIIEKVFLSENCEHYVVSTYEHIRKLSISLDLRALVLSLWLIVSQLRSNLDFTVVPCILCLGVVQHVRPRTYGINIEKGVREDVCACLHKCGYCLC